MARDGGPSGPEGAREPCGAVGGRPATTVETGSVTDKFELRNRHFGASGLRTAGQRAGHSGTRASYGPQPGADFDLMAVILLAEVN